MVDTQNTMSNSEFALIMCAIYVPTVAMVCGMIWMFRGNEIRRWWHRRKIKFSPLGEVDRGEARKMKHGGDIEELDRRLDFIREIQALAEIRGFGKDRQYSALILSGKLEDLETKVYGGEMEAFQARLANVKAAAAAQ